MVVGNALLVALALGAFVLLVQAVRQNLPLWRQVREGDRSVPRLLGDALLLWSPLAAVILAAVLATHWLADALVASTYRLTPVDEFCRVEGIASRPVIPCTGLDGRLRAEAIRRAGTQAELEHLLSARFREARRRAIAVTADALRTADPATMLRPYEPRRVLGLPRAPDDDPELRRLRAALRAQLDRTVEPARDPLDMLRFAAERNERVLQLQRLTALARARRRDVEDDAYAGLPPETQGQLWLEHRVSHALAAIPVRLDAGAQAALSRLRSGSGDADADLARVRGGIASLLARGESQAADILAGQARTPRGPRRLELALRPPPLCTLERADPDLRRLAADFAAGDARAGGFARNAGTFPCFGDAPAEALRLSSLGLRDSVRRSIDRWHAQALASSARRLGTLARGTVATQDAAREVADAVPHGIDLGRSPCGLLHPVGCIANGVRQAAEESLAEAFAPVAEPTLQGANAIADTADDLDARIGAELATLDARLAGMRDIAHERAGTLFLAADLLRLLGWLALALVVAKSFLYVLALEVFHHEGGLTFGLDAEGTVEGEVRAARQLTIDRDFPRPLITRKQLSNADNSLRLAPWPFSAPLARLLRGRYLLYTRGTFLADAERPARGMVASASGGMSIVEWKMQPGEEVVFAYRDFFGASDNIRLRSQLSLRLSTLLLGRLFFRSARCEDGEGRLLLRAHVEEIDPQHIRAIPPERLLAWHKHVRFGIHSGRTPWTTLIDGYTLVRMDRPGGPDGQVLVSSEDAGSSFGSLRFVRRMFSALF